MKVHQLIEFLTALPADASVHLDDEDYPAIDGCYLSSPLEFSGDDEDAPPTGVVLLELTYPVDSEEEE